MLTGARRAGFSTPEAAMPPPPRQQIFLDQFFPVAGLDVSVALEMQTPDTTPEGVNVRVFEPGTYRARGGMRCGLSKYIPQQLPIGGPGTQIQMLNYVVDPQATALGISFADIASPPLSLQIPDPSNLGRNLLGDGSVGQIFVGGSGFHTPKTYMPMHPLPPVVNLGITLVQYTWYGDPTFLLDVNASGTLTLNGVTQGDVLVVRIAAMNGSNAFPDPGPIASTVTDDQGNSWTKAVGKDNAYTYLTETQCINSAIWYAVAAASGNTTVTVSCTSVQPTVGFKLAFYEFAGVATGASSTLNGGINASQGTLVVNSATGWPAAPFRVFVGSETMIVTLTSGTTFTVQRGALGSTAASHSNGTTIAGVAGPVDDTASKAQTLAGSQDNCCGYTIEAFNTNPVNNSSHSGDLIVTVGYNLADASFANGYPIGYHPDQTGCPPSTMNNYTPFLDPLLADGHGGWDWPGCFLSSVPVDFSGTAATFANAAFPFAYAPTATVAASFRAA
jgi:hypothetical protein